MKRFFSILICVIILFSITVPTRAEGMSVGVSASADSVAVGSTVTVSVSVSGTVQARSCAVSVSHGAALELVSGEWLLSGASLSKFDPATKKGVLSYAEVHKVGGSIFKLVFRATQAVTTAQSISVSVECKNGTVSVGSGSRGTSVRTLCKTHKYGAFERLNDTQHKRFCPTCGNTEIVAHTWGNEKIVKSATCKEAGSKTVTCTGCGFTKTVVIPKTAGHTYSSWSVNKKATCTDQGEESRTCSVCGKKETRTVKATGHTFGAWKDDVAATCEKSGQQKRVCTKCGKEETRTVEPLGHDFKNPVTVKEATVWSVGILEGKCKRCGKTTRQTVPCGYTDSATGIVFSMEEGVFSQGSTIKVVLIEKDHRLYPAVRSAVSDISEIFVAYDLIAEKSGKTVQPTGKVRITLPVPTGWGKNFTVYTVNSDGNKTAVPFSLTKDGKSAVIELTRFQTVVLCSSDGKTVVTNDTDGNGDESKEDADTSADADDLSDCSGKKKGNCCIYFWLCIVLGLLVILLTVLLIISMLKGRRKGKRRQNPSTFN